MATKFKKGRKIICFHYKDMPTVTIESVSRDQIWVYETKRNGEERHWWGPRSWFTASRKTK